MLQLDTLKRLFAIADVSRDPYAVADAVAALLRTAPDDTLKIHYSRALAALGLGAAARRAIGNVSSVPEALRSQISAVPPGTVPWSSRARRFRANLAALTARWPAYGLLGDGWEEHAGRYELFLASDSNAFVLDTSRPIWSGWLGGTPAGGLANHRGAVAAWQFDKAKSPMMPPVAFDGLGYGWLAPHVMSTTADSFLHYSCAIHIVEPDPVALCILMHIQDLQAFFGSPRVHLYAGEGAEERFRAAFADRTVSVPGSIITQPLTRRGPVGLGQVCEALSEARLAARREVKAQIDAYYADKDAGYWAGRFAEASSGGPPLRVLGLTTRYSTVLRHSMEEMRQAALAAGCDMRVAMESDDCSLENPALEMIGDFKPDVLFQLSRMRYENPALPANLPFVCWDQDNLPCMRAPAATASLNPLTYVAGHGANFGYSHLSWPRGNVIFCHPAGATFRYSAEPLAGDVLARYACDLSYVSNASDTPRSFADRAAPRWAPLGRLFEACAGAVLEQCERGRVWDFLALQELVGQTCAGPGIRVDERQTRELAMDLHALADRAFRHVTLEWVSRWCGRTNRRLRLYGAGWEAHPTLGAHAAGRAQQGEELRAIYQASTINLQIMGAGFIHSRALDGIAAGGFFMNRKTPVDGLGEPEISAIYRLARWCAEAGDFSEEAIAASTDPPVQKAWPLAQQYFTRHNVRWVLTRALETWAEMPPACESIPHLEEVTFASEEEFGTKADAFFADAARRREIARAMHAEVDRHFSYTARWKQFVAAVEAGIVGADALSASAR